MTREQWQEHDRAVRRDRQREEAAARDREHERVTELAASWGVPRNIALMAATGTGVLETPSILAVAGISNLGVLSGGVGCGKTTAASVWLCTTCRDRAPRRKSMPPRFVTAAAIERMSRYTKASDAVAVASLLVIDDLGMEYADAKGNFLADLDALVDARYRDELPTVITTNLTAPMFRERYGRRIRDRIAGLDGFHNVNGPSLRAAAGGSR